MKINTINNIQNKNINIKKSKINNTQNQNFYNTNLNMPANSKLYQAYNNITFKGTKAPSYQVLGRAGQKENVILRLNHIDEPVTLKPNCVDTYFRDNTGKINNSYIEDFICMYDSFYADEVKVSEAVKTFAKDIIAQADENAQKSPDLGLPEKVIPFDIKQKRINYYTENNQTKSCAQAYLYNESENRKKFPIIALDKAFMLMQLSKTKDGYSFLKYPKTKPIINELFAISDKTQNDFKTPILNATKDENGVINLDLIQLVIDYMNESNWQEATNVESITKILDKVRQNPNNDMSRVIGALAYISSAITSNPEELEYLANQCINKKTNEFNEETFGTIVNLFTESEFYYPLIFDNFSLDSVFLYTEMEKEVIHSYLEKNIDPKTATIKDDADSIIEFTQEFFENKKSELN